VIAVQLAAAVWLLADAPITDRHYAIDGYIGPVFGPPRAVAMGGVGTALAEGSMGMHSNPAAAAKRPMSARGRWDWDFDLDAIAPWPTSDLQNDRQSQPITAELVTTGLLGLYGPWGLGVSLSSAEYQLPALSASAPALSLELAIGRLVLARSFDDERVVVGLGVSFADLEIDQGNQTLLNTIGPGLEAGAIYSAPQIPVRVGVRAGLATRARPVELGCDPLACAGRILPEATLIPWEVAAGVAYRLGPSAWNERPTGLFRDERALIVGVDLLLTGPASAVSPSGFAQVTRRASGRAVSPSLRLGAEHETVPGRLRLRAGAYFEPPRVDQASARVHATFGFEARLFRFNFWHQERRVALSGAGDVSARYGSISLSLALWH
jgi:hypothetical protein